MAEDLGKRLLAEIEETGLDESYDETKPIPYFGLPVLDRILHAVQPAAVARAKSSPPIIELASLTYGGGATQLLYLLSATAVLPQTYGGKHASVVIIDTDNTFSVARLAQQLRTQIQAPSCTPNAAVDIERTVPDSLSHVHVLRPQSPEATIAALRALPAYLFDPHKHHSSDRAMAFVALDSATAFAWQARAEEAEPAATAPHASLADALRDISRQLASPVILTAHYLQPVPMGSNSVQPRPSIRSALPAVLSVLPSLRLLVRRSGVRRFPAGISASEARREAGDRQRVVDIGKFECMVNRWGMVGGEERGLERFEFRILPEGHVEGIVTVICARAVPVRAKIGRECIPESRTKTEKSQYRDTTDPSGWQTNPYPS
nr:hypothetical protein CFP56_21263 [Quercus suber]